MYQMKYDMEGKMKYQDAINKLKMYGQEHVLKYFDEL